MTWTDHVEEAIEQFPDLLVRVEGHLIASISPSVQSILGIEPETLVGRPLVDLAIVEDVGAFVSALDQLHGGAKDWDFETRCRHSEGRILRIEWRAGQTRGENAWYFSGRDVTQRGTRDTDDILLSLASADPSEAIVVLQTSLPYLPVVYCNESYQAMMGQRNGEILGKSCMLLENEGDDSLSALKRAVRENRHETFQVPVRLSDSTNLWCETRVVPISGRDGDSRHVVLKIRDVTEQVQSEIEIRNRARLQTRTAEVSKTGGWSLDLVSMELSWTEQVYRIHALPTSYRPDVESAINFYDDASKPLIEQAVNRCIENGEPYSLRLRIIDANGQGRWVHANGEADMENGKAIRMFGTFQDITEQVEQEREKMVADQRFRAAFEGAPHGVAMVDPRGRFLQTNLGLREMLGYSEDEILGLTFIEITHPDDFESNVDLANALMNDEIDSMTVEKRYKRRDGNYIPAVLSTSLVRDENGEPLYYVSHIRDLTAEKRLERERHRHQLQMQQAQKLESLGVLAGGIAHDFNNLLMGIIGNAQVAMLGLDKTETAHEPMNRVISGSKRAAELCEQLLAYAGKGKFEVKSMDLGKLVLEMGRLLDVAAKKDSTIDYRLPDESLNIVGDGTQIRQVVMNLITNAADAVSGANGKIVIKASANYLSEKDLSNFQLNNDVRPGHFAVLVVEDNGVGMDDATVRRIFDPFFTTKKKGRGLGLAAVLGIIKSHGGAVNVKSKEGAGTSFTVALPLSMTDEEIEESTRAFTLISSGGGTVLFVDDDESIRDLAEGLLTHAGYDVILGNNGVEGLARFKENRGDIDAIVLDLMMPEMDGRECHRRIREIDQDVPIIFSSGYVGANEDEIAKLEDIAGFLRKPYGSEQLFSLLGQNIRERTD